MSSVRATTLQILGDHVFIVVVVVVACQTFLKKPTTATSIKTRCSLTTHSLNRPRRRIVPSSTEIHDV